MGMVNLRVKARHIIKSCSILLLVLLLITSGVSSRHLAEYYSVKHDTYAGYYTFVIPDADNSARLLIDKLQFNEKEIVSRVIPDVTNHPVTLWTPDEQSIGYTFFFSLSCITRAPPAV